MTALVRAEAVDLRIGERSILRNVDLELHRGEVTVLIGPNGAGKTTLLEVLAGIDRVDGGTVERSGRVAAALQGATLAHRTARKNVELALAWWGVPRSERTERARAALGHLGALDLADRSAGTLSGGEARRVHLARALAVDPDVLLLDEPFAGLDVSARADLLYAAADVIRSERRATLVVVHERAEAWALADRVLVMLDGTIAAAGTPREVLEQPPTLEVARFVGFVGSVIDGDRVRVMRPSDVRIDEDGPHRGTVVRRVPLEEGVRIEVALAQGVVVAVVPAPGPAQGSQVGVSMVGGLWFGDAEHGSGRGA